MNFIDILIRLGAALAAFVFIGGFAATATGFLIEGLTVPGVIAMLIGGLGIILGMKYSPAVRATMERLARWH